MNLHRRHLNESQRADIAAQLATRPQGRPDEKVSIDTLTVDEAAERLGVGRESVMRARAVRKTGAPELIAAVQRGEIAVSAAKAIAVIPAPAPSPMQDGN